MQYEAGRFWLEASLVVINIGGVVYTYLSNREKVNNARFRKAEERVLKVEERVTKVEGDRGTCSQHPRMEGMDTKLLESLEKIVKGVSRVEGRLEGINRMVDLLTQNELGGKG